MKSENEIKQRIKQNEKFLKGLNPAVLLITDIKPIVEKENEVLLWVLDKQIKK